MCLIRLPTEIIQQIVINLVDDTRALVALSLSSKSLCPSAQRRLFQRVKLHSRCSRRLDSVLSSNPSLASYVKRLIIIHYIPNPRCKTLADGSYKLIPSRKCDDAAIISILGKLSSSPIRSITLFSTDSTTPIDWFTLENAFRTVFLGIIGQPLLRELAILNIFNIPTDTLNRCENLERLSTQLPLFQRALSVPVPTSTGGALPVGGGVSAQEDARSGMFPPAAQESRGRTSTQLVHYPITLNLHISVDGTLQDLESLRSSIGLFKVERFALTFSVPITSVPVLQLLSQLTAIEELYLGFTWIGSNPQDRHSNFSKSPTDQIHIETSS
ncbi:hypothetical protein BDN72DRAFT_198233 [Pluteus cervinus]|uniref:Uncharacterized protein n=1 Tax=Pluteus cervinus TaxID=181527 RepID=A0ACD3B691_9AGAR|nr:hypothetical protein BDN72DRAFT_198233 [Pluteus cervinus]